jgi:hypothetical protein
VIEKMNKKRKEKEERGAAAEDAEGDGVQIEGLDAGIADEKSEDESDDDED